MTILPFFVHKMMLHRVNVGASFFLFFKTMAIIFALKIFNCCHIVVVVPSIGRASLLSVHGTGAKGEGALEEE